MAFKLRKEPVHYSKNSKYISYDDFLDKNYEIGYNYSSDPIDEYTHFISIYQECLNTLSVSRDELPLSTFAENSYFSKDYCYEGSWTFLSFKDKFPFSKEEYAKSKAFKRIWAEQKKQNDKIIKLYEKKLEDYNKWYIENLYDIEKLLEKKEKQKVDKIKKQKALLERQKAKIEKELREISNA